MCWLVGWCVGGGVGGLALAIASKTTCIKQLPVLTYTRPDLFACVDSLHPSQQFFSQMGWQTR